MSVTFPTKEDVTTFFDALETAKGPSLGTNFTLSSPYTLLAHYGELEWVGAPLFVILHEYKTDTVHEGSTIRGRDIPRPGQCRIRGTEGASSSRRTSAEGA